MVQVWICTEDQLERTGVGLEAFGLQPCLKTLHSGGVLQALGLQPWFLVQGRKAPLAARSTVPLQCCSLLQPCSLAALQLALFAATGSIAACATM